MPPPGEACLALAGVAWASALEELQQEPRRLREQRRPQRLVGQVAREPEPGPELGQPLAWSGGAGVPPGQRLEG
jgi:hypothetical protein